MLLAFLHWISPSAARAASYPPEYHFRTIHTARIDIHFHQGLEVMARQAARLAPEILEREEARLLARVPHVSIVLSDEDDSPNGFTWLFPYPLIQIRAAAPDGSDFFGNFEDWLRLVLTHEITHLVHLEPARRIPGAARRVFGRAPYLFPNLFTPVWLFEGLATYEETEGTAFGRGRDPDVRMVRRMSALQGGPPTEDLPAVSPDGWPNGYAPYFFGEAFLRDLQARCGAGTLRRLSVAQSGRLVPFTIDLTSDQVTGQSIHARWRDWRQTAGRDFEPTVARIRQRGVTRTRALTARGIAQVGPVVSPDGQWVAYTSQTLTRYRAIRLVRTDGTEDRAVVDRNGGSGLSWTPDGRALVFDEPETHRLFASRSDLRMVDLANHRVRWLTRGMRARDPDVSPDGRRVVFVRRFVERSELALLELDTGRAMILTVSPPGTQWSGPRFSPDSQAILASRWSDAGYVDLMRVDPRNGQTVSLTNDRARDLEPAWMPDGQSVVFRSDRDGVSNLYSLRLADGKLSRLTNVLGGAFMPAVAPDGRFLVFADYQAEGFDIHLMEFPATSDQAVDAYVDRNPLPHPPTVPLDTPDAPYRPGSTLLPRWWSPVVGKDADDWRWGATTGGSDPLLRHVWSAEVWWGTATGRVGAKGYYLYDRYRPTFTVSASDSSDPKEEGVSRTREIGLSARFPISRTFKRDQSVSLAWRFRRESDPQQQDLDLGGLEATWSFGGVQQHPFNISPVQGWRTRVGLFREDPAFGSDLALTKATIDIRAYTRLFGETDALALLFGAGTTFDQPAFRRSFAVGGFPESGLQEITGSNLSVLRGYPQNTFTGRHFANASVEYRFPLAHPQRGYRSLPFFVRHLHAALFFDAGHAWSDAFRVAEARTAAGASIGVDTIVAHVLPSTFVVGIAYGFAEKGATRLYFRTGLAF